MRPARRGHRAADPPPPPSCDSRRGFPEGHLIRRPRPARFKPTFSPGRGYALTAPRAEAKADRPYRHGRRRGVRHAHLPHSDDRRLVAVRLSPVPRRGAWRWRPRMGPLQPDHKHRAAGPGQLWQPGRLRRKRSAAERGCDLDAAELPRGIRRRRTRAVAGERQMEGNQAAALPVTLSRTEFDEASAPASVGGCCTNPRRAH